MKLTENQSKLVEQNHNLIYGFAKKYNLDIEEWYGVLALALCKTALSFDSEKAKFSTLYYLCASQCVEVEKRKERTQKRIPKESCISLDEPIDDTDLTLKTCLADTRIDFVKDLELKEQLYTLLKTLSERDKKILRLVQLGVPQEVIGKIAGMSQSNVSRKLNQLRKKLKNL
jgi:RNA polymerase sigma factor (sigma-70 family)